MYSSGMRARLGFALAMEMHPDVFLVEKTFGRELPNIVRL
jgi:ABC-type polysaccharide/polyol phosphate transport system ATPase subunit